ncbi:hypothetical protein POVWA2_006180 [Plasmodium ovale wallikeri]|uniref:Uncharacterized protein n=1 Tax=Plasmodium ovale wallikeri TaxID=864142 RepID=A0A1A8YJU0_PLAOA|nr:hypothetical protein POVWA2_006180 [Plasmodium ovale wallikeri]SBT40814.1 hypothetical protein POVWA1_042800 [Plasmodium ovale wallikeri]
MRTGVVHCLRLHYVTTNERMRASTYACKCECECECECVCVCVCVCVCEVRYPCHGQMAPSPPPSLSFSNSTRVPPTW